MAETENEKPVELPDGDYAIVECMGHRTLVGRVQEVTKIGVAMLQVDQIADGVLAQTYFVPGSSIYCLTPCTKEQALKRGLITVRRTLIAGSSRDDDDQSMFSDEENDDGENDF